MNGSVWLFVAEKKLTIVEKERAEAFHVSLEYQMFITRNSQREGYIHHPFPPWHQLLLAHLSVSLASSLGNQRPYLQAPNPAPPSWPFQSKMQ